MGVACLLPAIGLQAASLTIVTDPNATDTPLFLQLLGINNAGTIVGYTGMGTPNPNRGFILTVPNSFTALNPNLTGGFLNSQTQVFGINGAGNTTDGFVIDTNGVTHGFVDVGNGPTATAVDNPGTVTDPAVMNQLLGLNQNGTEAAGFYADGADVDFGYTYDVGTHTFTALNVPSSLGFVAGDNVMGTGVNNSSMVTGFFTNGAGVSFGFLLSGGIYSLIDVPGGISTQPLSINDLGQIVGTYVGADGLNHGFIDTGGHFSTFDGVPGAPMNLIQGINDTEQIVGFATVDNIGTTVGFTGTVPEPATLLCSGLGILVGLAMRFRSRITRRMEIARAGR
ncbi:MAG TPA: PEP-CTERM sorting domain-containing protein [Bryobacteraceae bacterium]|nr:PEP-CTERM sorting domain-containing protein [Bryobacteraceae bacterium]